ncbi:microcin C ABC transporter permease YejB [Desulfurispirillum indicum]|uniref:Binding-protein-dependent transport systems inner membrane component n=1 Tax=Desulfurispirillum indicum (strain ATCC BAA-1389 / DSM 22839 / S5) TaxID=653733 RepID=E6W344_DESIS|nr:microcin C ABC transporter permease YejB [Desulfurispirillum indicum]ADU65705.1 binding-protein-dependent transport systems inner membrane component [Desulfurispirillum indicum S5]UCZ57461.1 microcin C ABC transporter permease YejB [Desulfurispirillum indicum]
MVHYILRRLLLIIPTLFGIMLLNFIIVQSAPGGPVERAMAQLHGFETGIGMGRGDAGGSEVFRADSTAYRGAQGIDPDLLRRIERQYGFDRPAHERFWIMIRSYLVFDFGESFYREKSVMGLIIEKMPVSITLGLWTTLLAYAISVPLGIAKALRHGSRFDVWSSTVVVVGYAIPNFLFAIILIVLFAGGSYFAWFPLRGLTSPHFHDLSLAGKVGDYLWHITLPVLASVVSSFATMTMLTKNSFLDEINKQYVMTARAKGLTERGVLYGHVFRNAMLIIIAGVPAALLGIFLTGSLLIEIIFSLDGLGLLGFEAVMSRDYPVIFGTLYIFTLIGLLLKLVGDIAYMLIDPRIDFERR